MFSRQSVNAALLLWGCLFCIIAVVCLAINYNFNKRKKKKIISIQILCALLLLSDVFAWIFRGDITSAGYVGVRVSNFIVFLMSDVTLMMFHSYVCCNLFENKEKNSVPGIRVGMVYVLCVIGIVMVIISQFTNLYYYIDADNLYHRNDAYIISVLIPFAGMVIDMWLLLEYRASLTGEMLASMMSYVILPVIATIIQLFCYGVSFINLAIAGSAIIMFIAAMNDQNKAMLAREKETAELKISLLISQIAPHFIYNTLASIRALCAKNPVQAQELIDDFAGFLRGNLNSLNKEKIPFKQELEYVKHYLSIEKVRFGNRVQAEYDIREENFIIPVLAIQIMVENAVKHGLYPKEDGEGIVRIEAVKEGENIVVTVKDNGVGFDPEKIREEEECHIGIKNTQERIERLCGGTVTINSIIGKGTEVIIEFPIEGNEIKSSGNRGADV